MTSLSASQAAKELAERVSWTFAQNFVIILVASGSAGLYDHQQWGKALMVALWASLFALLTTVFALYGHYHPVGQVAVLYRAGVTILQTFLASMATSTFTSFSDAGALSALAAAFSVALIAGLKSLVGLTNPNTLGDSTAVPAVEVKRDQYDVEGNTGAAYRFPPVDQ